MFEIEETKDIIILTTNQTIDNENTADILKNISEIAAKSHHSKVLVDLRKALIYLTFMGHYEGAHEYVKYCSGLKVAFVFSEVKEDYEFGATVALNCGGTLRLFDSIDDANDWLLKDADI